MTEFKEFLRELSEQCMEEYQRIAVTGGHKEDVSDSAEAITEVDERMTEVIMDAFRARPEKFSFESEELKKKSENLVVSGDYTVVFDEIDGTGNMKNERGPFGPVIGIAEGDDPVFDDVVAAIFYDLKNDSLYEAYSGAGAYRDGEEIGVAETIPEEDIAVRGLVDQAMLGKKPEIAESMWRYHCKDLGSMAFNIALVASDRADFLVTGGHGYVKENNTAEEIGPLYLLVKEAGGEIVDWEGEDIGGTEIGMDRNKSHDVVVAPNQEFAERLTDEIKNDISR
jgi:fructose-1,6-bisphosphatase/inositol monophosphatase family enzyme